MSTSRVISSLRFAVLGFGTAALAFAPQGIPWSASVVPAIWFNLCAYLGLRIPVLRAAIVGKGYDDHLSWSGAFVGALIGMVPLLTPAAASVRGQLVLDDLRLLVLYYAVGKATCTVLGCCEAHVRWLVRLPMIELIGAVSVLAASFSATASLRAVGIVLLGLGAIRTISRAARAANTAHLVAVLRPDGGPCIVAGVVALFVHG